MKVWDLRSLKAVSTQRMEGDVPFLSFHPSDDVLELGQEFRVQSLDWHNGKLLGSRETHETAALVHSRDGRYRASRLARSGAITLSCDRGGEQREIVGALSSLAELSDDKQRLLVSGPALWLHPGARFSTECTPAFPESARSRFWAAW